MGGGGDHTYIYIQSKKEESAEGSQPAAKQGRKGERRRKEGLKAGMNEGMRRKET